MQEIALENLYIVRDPKNFLPDMRKDVEVLLTNRCYLSLTTIIVLCLDALAAGSGEPKKSKFENFVTKHFPDLCTALNQLLRRRSRRAGRKAHACYTKDSGTDSHITAHQKLTLPLWKIARSKANGPTGSKVASAAASVSTWTNSLANS